MSYQPSAARRLSIALSALLACGAVASCGDSSSPSGAVAAAPPAAEAAEATPTAGADAEPVDAPSVLTTLVGDLAGSTTKLGLIIDGDKVWGYLCDPDAAAVGVTGSVSAGAVNLAEPDGATVVAGTYADGEFVGTVNLDGAAVYDVTAKPATGQAGVFAHYEVDGTTTELGVWIRDFAGKAVGNVTTFAADPSDPANVAVTEGTSDVPAEVVPFGFGDRARCFLASRKLVKAMQQGGSANKEQAALEYARACNAAFQDTTS